MNILKLQGQLKNNQIILDQPDEELSKQIAGGAIVIITNVFNREEILSCRQKIYTYGQTTPESNPPRSADTINFHRIDNNHPMMSVKRIAHFFRFSYKNQGDSGIFRFFEPMNYLRNRLAGLEPEFTFYEDYKGYLSQPALLHYPRGGGYLQNHVDPVEPQMVEMVMLASEKGVDFKEGGLSIFDNGKWLDIESMCKLGDMILFRPDIPHRVDPVDPDATLEFNENSGRWIFFSPIANIKNLEINEKGIDDRKSY